MSKASVQFADDSFDLDRAIEVFVRGGSFTRSFSHPCRADRVGAMWVVRDAPRKGNKNYRKDEWIARGPDAEAADAAARKLSRGRFSICAIRADDEPDAPIREAYRALGYRLMTTEAFMAHALDKIPRVADPVPVQRVLTHELAERVARANRSRLAMPAHLAADSPLRLYAALDGEEPIGWVRSITIDDCTWVASVYVDPKYRRRGIAKAMMVKMLRDDRALGAKHSVLLSSQTGALLYPNVGYNLIGQLFVYAPKRR